ncbi:uncharacterized protein TRIADDRAFT_60048 [Trichoplax adhaerens]|uniref:G-protein coupled receptors family 1 profile domain-containing protein n=1 Tax=Trichoplax adhaerens TaxID=10228 RepID=B3S757_TRIAD|nr:hypothetical protein TRIADDRAFT_60048 [Trichoplax adhaerens]EDV21515.1 hypothetical protein TRIADDRAFT_60048 [Trichoplax adhaerens]|eukprot:XP_002116115.1 hypothetical protein TRIADDRAFT_60048 [Trichoplax adhaerens]
MATEQFNDQNSIEPVQNTTQLNKSTLLISAIALSVISVCGLVGNMIVLILFPKIRPKKPNFAKIHFQLLWHVALASLFNCTLAVPMLILDVLLEEDQHYIPCIIYKITTVGCTSVVCFCFTMLAFERLLAADFIKRLHYYARSHEKRFNNNRFILAALWICTWSIQSISLARMHYPSHYLPCYHIVNVRNHKINQTILAIVRKLDIASIIWENFHFWIAAVTTILSFILVTRKISTHISSAASLHLQDNDKFAKMTSKMRKVGFTLVVIFLISFTPLTIIELDDLCGRERHPDIRLITMALTDISSAINPIIYFVMYQRFRQAIKALLTSFMNSCFGRK